MMFVRSSPAPIVMWSILFASAGTLAVPAFWVYGLIPWLFFGVTYTTLARRRPDVVSERLRPPNDRDRATRRLALLPFLAHLVVAGIDVGRAHGSHVPVAAQGLGFVLVVSGFALAAWTVFANPYASSAVRIQSERGHTVVTEGPYRIVRHPMYLGVVLVVLGSGPALGSWIAAALLLPLIAIFVRRTRLEDRMLHDELPGYAEYARNTRWRVVPGVY